ncbi:methyl-accepting chemotaxis protein [Desulfobotulus sp.]|jgi:methyl-accepting chemotaxis protein|uniref:methyl-accepting chemotaxis protein n=1 Tax=Desulfobotulus sp. TaxID=1940337 RepID=UPI002A359FE1|nr:methyl-accepting chemotaxis protein [Desulfobotulus sp.]MDY0164481.1 methyl-accepting chemotaxis protein [Desulfobotulus sp.]
MQKKNRRIPLQKRISVRMVTTVLLLTTLILTGMGFLQYQNARTRLEQGLHVDADLAIQRMTLTLKEPLYNYDMTQAEAILRSEMQDHRLLALALSDPTGQKEILLLGRDETQATVFVQKLPQTRNFRRTSPIQKEDTVLGNLTVLMNPDFFQENLRSILKSTIFTILLLDILLLAVMASSLQMLVFTHLKAMIGAIRDLAQGDGDLTRRISEKRGDELSLAAHWINLFVSQIHGIMNRIRESGDKLTGASAALLAISDKMTTDSNTSAERATAVARATGDMSQSMGNVVTAMEEASTNTAMVAAAAEQMTATIGEIARNTEKARRTTQDAVSRSEGATEKMSHLERIASDIGKVTESITEISAQTNLLALNATIEAARAGEAGKGFAVVAAEIKTLATQTSTATENIRNIIGSAQNLIVEATGEVKEVSRAIQATSDMVTIIATAVEEQSAATREISGNVVQAAQGIQEVNQNMARMNGFVQSIRKDIEGVDRISKNMNSVSAEVHGKARDVADMAAVLQGLIGRFSL